MKKIYVLWSLAIATLFANVFFACTSEDTLDDFYAQQGFTMQLVKTPDFVVYSDGNVLASTFLTTRAETRGEGDIVEPVEGVDYFLVEAYDYRGSINGIWHTTGYKEIPDVYAPYAANAPLKSNDGKSGVEGVSGAEYAYVMKYIQEHPEEAKDKCTVEKDYFVQNVGSSNTSYALQIPNWNHTGYRTETYIGGNVMNYLYFYSRQRLPCIQMFPLKRIWSSACRHFRHRCIRISACLKLPLQRQRSLPTSKSRLISTATALSPQ